MGISDVGRVIPIFVCAILGDSADVLWCSTTYLEIAHAKMGSTNPTPLTPIFACAILGIVEVFNYTPENRTRENGWWWCCISESHFRVCDFGVVPLFQNALQILRGRFFPLVNALGFAFATCFLTLQTQILRFQWNKKWVKYTVFIPQKTQNGVRQVTGGLTVIFHNNWYRFHSNLTQCPIC